MSDSRKEPVPESVGKGRRRFIVHKDRLLGSGHFGEVYMGEHFKTGERVAIKLDRVSGATNCEREGYILKCMAGQGVPRVHWTGEHGNFHVIVMDLLGISVQKYLEQSTKGTLPWDTVTYVGRKGVDLLRTLHNRGFVHGDVKPENFLFQYREDGLCNPRDGLFMVDLGLASKWRDPLRSDGHIGYKQRVGRFSGTVRYAATHTHMGRWISRRDDLESLAYVLLFLHLGHLPWQGFTGEDKGMRVGEMKGRLSVPEICGGAPLVMQYFLAYCRALRFDDDPDYDYLHLLLSPEHGMAEVKRLQALEAKGAGGPSAALAAAAAAANGGTKEGGAAAGQGQDRGQRGKKRQHGAVARRPSTSGKPGDKRKRHDDDDGLDWSDEDEDNDDVDDDDDDDPAENIDDDDEDLGRQPKSEAAVAKRPTKRAKVVPPDEAKVFQWIIVTTALTGQSQNFSTQNSYNAMVTEIKRQWDKGRRITTVSLPGEHWISVCNGHCGIDLQKVKYISGPAWPQDWVDRQLRAGYWLTCAAGNARGWVLVCSTFEDDLEFSYEGQIFKHSDAFPAKWVADNWDNGYSITTLTTQGEGKHKKWLVVMTHGGPYTHQCVEFGFNYPSEFIHRRWDEGYRVTHVACAGDMSAYVMSKGDDFFDPPEQRTVRTNTQPLDKIREDWQKGLYVVAINWGRVL